MCLLCVFQCDEEMQPGGGHSSSTASCNSEGNLWFRFAPGCQEVKREEELDSWWQRWDATLSSEGQGSPVGHSSWGHRVACPCSARAQHTHQHRLGFAALLTTVPEVWDGVPQPVTAREQVPNSAGTPFCRSDKRPKGHQHCRAVDLEDRDPPGRVTV